MNKALTLKILASVFITFIGNTCICQLENIPQTLKCFRNNKIDFCITEYISDTNLKKELKEYYHVKTLSNISDEYYLEHIKKKYHSDFLHNLINAQIYFKKSSKEEEKGFLTLKKCLNKDQNSTSKCVVLKDMLEYLVFVGVDTSLTHEYLKLHRINSYDKTELKINEYYNLLYDLNRQFYGNKKLINGKGRFEKLISFFANNNNYRYAYKASGSYGAYLSQQNLKSDSSLYWYSKAQNFLNKTDSLFKRENDFLIYSNIAFTQIQQKKFRAAITSLVNADSTSSKLSIPQNKGYYYEWLSQAYEGLKIPDSALIYKKLSTVEIEKARRIDFASAIKETEEKYKNDELKNDIVKKELLLKSRTYLVGFFSILLLGSLFATYLIRKLGNQKRANLENKLNLQISETENQKLKALTAERTRIASEMHDDLGGGLTTIKFLSQKAIRNIEDEKTKSQMQKIVDNAQNLVSNMSEIIWAMNAGFDTLDNLIAYSRRYTYEFLEPYNIKINFTSENIQEGIPLTGEQRRNLFLILKEALNNIVKHAEATEIEIRFSLENELTIHIVDNGKGLTVENQFGNGIANMKKRVRSINGSIIIKSIQGTSLIIKIPL